MRGHLKSRIDIYVAAVSLKKLRKDAANEKSIYTGLYTLDQLSDFVRGYTAKLVEHIMLGGKRRNHQASGSLYFYN
jgi:hypothetical protein